MMIRIKPHLRQVFAKTNLLDEEHQEAALSVAELSRLVSPAILQADNSISSTKCDAADDRVLLIRLNATNTDHYNH